MPTDNMYKVKVTAPLHTEVATLASVASILSLPEQSDRQPDLQYMTAIFVSSGMNKNGAVFMGSELVKARKSIDSKAVDIEHEEQAIIGQITGSAFLKRDRTLIDAEKAAGEMSSEELDELEMDIGITAIIHKSRFPEIAKEIEEGQWMVSMEAYYRDYDIKVGDSIIPREKAEEMGFDKLVGTVVELKDGDKEMGFHLVGRVLRDIIFAGVGIVQNPANPRSIIMEAAAINEYVQEESEDGTSIIIDLATLNTMEKEGASSEITVKFIRDTITEAINAAIMETLPKKEEAVRDAPSIPGTCVSYVKYTYTRPEATLDDPPTDLSQYPLYTKLGDGATEVPGSEVAREHYCKLFDADCTARPGDATKAECLRNVFASTVAVEVAAQDKVKLMYKVQQEVVSLQSLLTAAKRLLR